MLGFWSGRATPLRMGEGGQGTEWGRLLFLRSMMKGGRRESLMGRAGGRGVSLQRICSLMVSPRVRVRRLLLARTWCSLHFLLEYWAECRNSILQHHHVSF